jgi:putative endopeptidase
MDRSIRPGDDFYRFAAGHWLEQAEIAGGEIRVGSREAVRANVEQRVRPLIIAAAEERADRNPVETLLGDYYASFADSGRREALGLTPVMATVRILASLSTPGEFAEAFGQAVARGHTSPLLADVSFDYQNTERMIARVAVEGLGLPSPDYYVRTEERYVSARQAYLLYIERVLNMAHGADARRQAMAILDFEGRIARHHWSGAARRDLTRITTIYDISRFEENFPGFDWTAYWRGVGYGELQEVVVQHPSATTAVVEEIQLTSRDALRAYLIFHYLASYADYLNSDLAAAAFEFSAAVRGLSAQPAVEVRAQRAVESAFSELVGRAYVERFFSIQDRDAALQIVSAIRSELRERISNAPDLAPSTRAEALAKIDALGVKIGYPAQWSDYSDLAIVRTDLAGNVARVRAWRVAQDSARLRRPADRERWFLPPHSTNAAYNPAFNEIILPAGILQAPFFDRNADPAVNFGAIGGVIGHELSHGFDDIGRRLDARGSMRDWWALSDAQRFSEQAERLVLQYEAFEYAPGYRVDGRLTLGENLADVNGLSLAVGAYRRWLGGRRTSVLDGYTGEQRVFLGWAQMRRAKERLESMIARMPSSPHAPDPLRVNGVVRNIDAWYSAFEIGPTDRLYLAPEDRVSTWGNHEPD